MSLPRLHKLHDYIDMETEIYVNLDGCYRIDGKNRIFSGDTIILKSSLPIYSVTPKLLNSVIYKDNELNESYTEDDIKRMKEQKRIELGIVFNSVVEEFIYLNLESEFEYRKLLERIQKFEKLFNYSDEIISEVNLTCVGEFKIPENKYIKNCLAYGNNKFMEANIYEVDRRNFTEDIIRYLAQKHKIKIRVENIGSSLYINMIGKNNHCGKYIISGDEFTKPYFFKTIEQCEQYLEILNHDLITKFVDVCLSGCMVVNGLTYSRIIEDLKDISKSLSEITVVKKDITKFNIIKKDIELTIGTYLEKMVSDADV